MAGDSEAGQTSLPRREDHPTTKHGLPFSKWEVLIGPSDWKDHASGDDGTQRYRTHKLPEGCSGPGIYELAIAVNPSDDGRVIRNLDKACIVPVYIGATDNIRTRLKNYGRDGGHLDRGNPTSASSEGDSQHLKAGPGLFKEIFARGFPILYRWAPVASREEAERKEAELLDKYDYAWNKRGNGPSRRDDVLTWLDKMAICTAPPSTGTHKAKERASEKKQMRGCGSSKASPQRKVEYPHELVFSVPSVSILPYRPRPVQEPRFSYLESVADKEDGPMHRNRPVEEKKTEITGTQCPGTRGRMAAPGGILIKEELPSAERSKRCDSHTCSWPTVTLAGDDDICGVIRGDGSLCRNPPEKGRKRCGMHKGQRVIGSAPPECGEIRIGGGQSSSSFCGVPMADGSICMQTPVCGRKRCEDHKGRRVTGSTTGSLGGSDVCEAGFFMSSSVCGVTMNNGAPCTAAPVPGRKRCARHKGRRI